MLHESVGQKPGQGPGTVGRGVLGGRERNVETRDTGNCSFRPPCPARGRASGIKAAFCAAGWPCQNAFESLGLVLRNPIRFLSILAISGIACSGTSPATTPAATDFNRASCPGLKSRCLSGLRCRTSASPQPHRHVGFWNHVASAAALAFRTFHARLAPSILLVFIANLRLNLNTLRCSRAIVSACYRLPDASVWFSAWFSWCV